ncbi:hypothetical protein BHE75_00736 [Sphingomonas haloaromaticamans]|uniref:Uncharacterized protein n=1 Tax=Edaphosphingomonas haloaromaticamans TaxID=653954 RepID=A0A1S1HE40_9SPHN|nr:hypothetical protein BHE75_00736 [Sphingomonas haloaromaticamans]
MIGTRISLCLCLLLPAGCATPRELKVPPSAPSLAEPPALPDLPGYAPPIPHEAPRSASGGTR